MDETYCFHGPSQRAKFGVDVGDDGIETCRRCRRPVRESVTRMASHAESPLVVVTTVANVPGCRVVAYRGVVAASAADHGRPQGHGPGSAWDAVMDDLRGQAAALGGNAVVGLQFHVASAAGGDTVHAAGTAVVAAPLGAVPLAAVPLAAVPRGAVPVGGDGMPG